MGDVEAVGIGECRYLTACHIYDEDFKGFIIDADNRDIAVGGVGIEVN